MRLGELLIQAGLLSPQQLEEALRAQVTVGGRLGTNLVELQMLDLDTVSRIVARQHGVPGAYEAHFDAADRALQARLSPELAAQYACVPLRRVGDDRVVFASIAPLDVRGAALIADQLGISYTDLLPTIAAELRIHEQLEHAYGVPRPARTPKLGRIGIKRYALGSSEIALPAKPVTTLDEATLAIRRSIDRSALADRVIDAVERFVPARAMLLDVREDAALGWYGEIAVPLDQPTLVAAALRAGVPARSPADHPIDARILDLLGVPHGDLVVSPIAIGTEVCSLLAVATERGAAVEGLASITSAAAVAFARLLRNANR